MPIAKTQAQRALRDWVKQAVTPDYAERAGFHVARAHPVGLPR